MQLNNKKVLITGGGRGIGLEIAKAFSAKGAQIVICGRSADSLAEAKQLINGHVETIPANLADSDAALKLADEIKQRWGGLDILINNAGIQYNYSFFNRGYDEIADDVDKELTVNLAAPVKLATALLPMLQDSEEAAIVNIGSGLALAPKTSAPIYCASKAGLRSFTRALRYQAEAVAPHINVVDVILPIVRTDMTEGRGSGKIEPSQVAGELIKGLGKGKSEIRIGKTKIFTLIMRFAPSVGYRILRGDMT